ncbi:hypothetical protein [Actinoplanes sp. NPDC051859]|uniref:hypothetical protein n=1 Tax=Actinoplanes sp. NPDC051859 TaxID=3363909 RepID=UPI00378825E4
MRWRSTVAATPLGGCTPEVSGVTGVRDGERGPVLVLASCPRFGGVHLVALEEIDADGGRGATVASWEAVGEPVDEPIISIDLADPGDRWHPLQGVAGLDAGKRYRVLAWNADQSRRLDDSEFTAADLDRGALVVSTSADDTAAPVAMTDEEFRDHSTSAC